MSAGCLTSAVSLSETSTGRMIPATDTASARASLLPRNRPAAKTVAPAKTTAVTPSRATSRRLGLSSVATAASTTVTRIVHTPTYPVIAAWTTRTSRASTAASRDRDRVARNVGRRADVCGRALASSARTRSASRTMPHSAAAVARTRVTDQKPAAPANSERITMRTASTTAASRSRTSMVSNDRKKLPR